MEIDINLLLPYLLNAITLIVGLYLGSRVTSKNIIKEVDEWMERSEFFQELKKMAKEQELIPKATEFFEEATKLVTSPEAKNFFGNATKVLKEFSSSPDIKFELPIKKIEDDD